MRYPFPHAKLQYAFTLDCPNHIVCWCSPDMTDILIRNVQAPWQLDLIKQLVCEPSDLVVQFKTDLNMIRLEALKHGMN